LIRVEALVQLVLERAIYFNKIIQSRAKTMTLLFARLMTTAAILVRIYNALIVNIGLFKLVQYLIGLSIARSIAVIFRVVILVVDQQIERFFGHGRVPVGRQMMAAFFIFSIIFGDLS
jgi:hypothetical protein